MRAPCTGTVTSVAGIFTSSLDSLAVDVDRVVRLGSIMLHAPPFFRVKGAFDTTINCLVFPEYDR